MVLHHQLLQGFIEPVNPAGGVLSACAGFVPCTASTGEDGGEFSQ